MLLACRSGCGTHQGQVWRGGGLEWLGGPGWIDSVAACHAERTPDSDHLLRQDTRYGPSLLDVYQDTME